MRGQTVKLLRKLYPDGNYKRGKKTWLTLSHKQRRDFCVNIRQYLTGEKPN